LGAGGVRTADVSRGVAGGIEHAAANGSRIATLLVEDRIDTPGVAGAVALGPVPEARRRNPLDADWDREC
jgi:hypothetical protein